MTSPADLVLLDGRRAHGPQNTPVAVTIFNGQTVHRRV
jgi:hypothetical protein